MTVATTNHQALVRMAVKREDGSIDVDATCELVRQALEHGPRQKASDKDMEAVVFAVHDCFDAVAKGSKVAKATLVAAARKACPAYGDKLLADVLDNGEFLGVRGAKGGWRRVADESASESESESA